MIDMLLFKRISYIVKVYIIWRREHDNTKNRISEQTDRF